MENTGDGHGIVSSIWQDGYDKLLINLTDNELLELYQSVSSELWFAEEEVHDAYVVYGIDFGNLIEDAEEHEKDCKKRIQAIRVEMQKRGISLDANS